MTALLTDEAIWSEAEEFTVNPISTDSFRQGFRIGAGFARSIYEARLAEEKVVREQLVEALKPFANFVRQYDRRPMRGMADKFYGIQTGTEFEAELTFTDCRKADAALSAAKEIK